MVRIRVILCRSILAAALLLIPQLALSEPKQPTEEESADVTFAKSFLGKTYDDELDVEGWINLGGGLVSPRSLSNIISARRTAPISCSRAARQRRRAATRRHPMS